MKIQINDKPVRYVHFGDNGQTMFVMMPIVGGDEIISSDNTCQAPLAQQGFFEKSSHDYVNKYSARNSLTAYAREVNAQLAILGKAQPNAVQQIIQQRQARRMAIQNYLDVVRQLSEHSDFSELSGPYPIYSQSIKTMLQKRDNLLGISLCPAEPDGARRFQDAYVCNFVSNLDVGLGSFFHSATATKLRQNFKVNPDFAKVFVNSILHKKTNAEPDTINSDAEFKKVIAFLEREIAAITHNPCTLEADGTEEQTADQIKKKKAPRECNYHFFTTKASALYPGDSFAECAEVIVNSIEEKDLLAEGFSPFVMSLGEKLTEDDNFSIKVQFLIGLINVYCRGALNIAQDFGQVIESSSQLQDDLVTAVRQAHQPNQTNQTNQTNQSIEAAIFKFIETNQNRFGLNRNFTKEERKKIQDWFDAAFKMANNSFHFDDFLFLAKEKPGIGFCFQGAFSVDLAGFVADNPNYLSTEKATLLQFLKPIAVKAKALNQTTRILTPEAEYVFGSVEIDDGVLENTLKDFATSGDDEDLYRLAYLLCSDVDGLSPQKVFEAIPIRLMNELKGLLPENKFLTLKAHIAALERTFVVQNFDTAFQTGTRTALISIDMARALNAAVVINYGPDYAFNYQSPKDMQSLLNIILSELNLKVLAVSEAYGGGYSITYKDDGVPDQLQKLVEIYKNKMHLSGGRGQYDSMTSSVYNAVEAQIYRRTDLTEQQQAEAHRVWNELPNNRWDKDENDKKIWVADTKKDEDGNYYYVENTKIVKTFEHLNVNIKKITFSAHSGYILQADDVQEFRRVEEFHAHHGEFYVSDAVFKRLRSVAIAAGKIDSAQLKQRNADTIQRLLSHLGFQLNEFQCKLAHKEKKTDPDEFTIKATRQTRERLKTLRSCPTQVESLMQSLTQAQKTALEGVEAKFKNVDEADVTKKHSELKSKCKLFAKHKIKSQPKAAVVPSTPAVVPATVSATPVPIVSVTSAVPAPSVAVTPQARLVAFRALADEQKLAFFRALSGDDLSALVPLLSEDEQSQIAVWQSLEPEQPVESAESAAAPSQPTHTAPESVVPPPALLASQASVVAQPQVPAQAPQQSVVTEVTTVPPPEASLPMNAVGGKATSEPQTGEGLANNTGVTDNETKGAQVNIKAVVASLQSYVQSIHKPTRWYQKPFRWLQKLFAPVRALKDAIRQQFVEDLNHINTENLTEAIALLKAKLNGLEHAQSYIEIVRARKHKGESVLEIAKGYLAKPDTMYTVKPTSSAALDGMEIEEVRKAAMLRLVP